MATPGFHSSGAEGESSGRDTQSVVQPESPASPRAGSLAGTLARLAGKSHGVVTRAELLDAGVTNEQVKRRLRSGSLLREHRGVYRVGHRAPSLEAHYLAAVKACGERALLCGRAAAHLLGLLKGTPAPPEVLTPDRRNVDGVVNRTCRAIDPRDATEWRGIPVTTVMRTLVDLAAVLAEPGLARAFHEASVLHRTKPADVERVLARRPTSPGARKLRRVLHGDAPVTLSRLEHRFLQRVRQHELPPPEMNRVVGGRRVDCRWSEHRLTVELDGYRYHSSRHAWEQDRRRERDARARGDEFRRYTYGDVFESPELMLAELRKLLRPKRAR